jgi:pimeloyl-ACP methyl ester carboxylesterase
MPICRLPDAELHYVEKGQGQPLLFLSGLAGDHLYWLGQLRAFSRQFRCIAVDFRDVGQSSRAAGPYSIQTLAGDVVDFLRALQLPPVHVVGLSMGGMVAQELALAVPDRVKSLALVNTVGRADDWFQAIIAAFEWIRLQVPDTASFFEAVLPWWVGHSFFTDSGRISWLRWLLRQNPVDQSAEAFQRQVAAIRGHDTLARLDGIRCPTLILSGNDDVVAPGRYSRELAAHLPHAGQHNIPGVGHAFPIEDAGQFNARLKEFLQSFSAPQRSSA